MGKKKDYISVEFRVTEEYIARVRKLQIEPGINKSKSEISLENSLGCYIRLMFSEEEFFLSCNTYCGLVTKTRKYCNVLTYTEMADGILFRMSKGRFLFLPFLDNGNYNSALVEILLLMGKKRRDSFILKESLVCSGVPFSKKIRLKLYQIRRGLSPLQLIFLMVASAFLGTIFVTQPLHFKPVEKQEAISMTVYYDQYKKNNAGRSSSTEYIDVYFTNGEIETVHHACSGYKLSQKLDSLADESELQILLHPKSEYIVEIKCSGVELLNFDFAQEKMFANSKGFFWLGMLLYGGLAYSVFEYVKRNRKRK